MNAASLTSPGRCTWYASAKPDSADDVGRSAVSSGVYRSAPGLMPTTLHTPVIGCLRPLSTILRSPGWGANTTEGGIGNRPDAGAALCGHSVRAANPTRWAQFHPVYIILPEARIIPGSGHHIEHVSAMMPVRLAGPGSPPPPARRAVSTAVAA